MADRRAEHVAGETFDVHVQRNRVAGPDRADDEDEMLGTPVDIPKPDDLVRAAAGRQDGFGEPDDLAGAVLWLASDAARFVTGSVVVVDGGFGAQRGV